MEIGRETGMSPYKFLLGVQDSYPHQDFYQQPDEYIFDPDPGTKGYNNGVKFQGNLPFYFILLCESLRPKNHCDPYMGFLLPENSGE